MSKINRIEDIEAWKLARCLTKTIYGYNARGLFSKDFGLANQIQRASVSVMSNIAEGFERKTNKEFIQFLYIAKGSIGELRSQLYIAQDLNYINEKDFNDSYKIAMTISRKLSSFIKYLNLTK